MNVSVSRARHLGGTEAVATGWSAWGDRHAWFRGFRGLLAGDRGEGNRVRGGLVLYGDIGMRDDDD